MKTFKQFAEMVGRKKINTDVPSTDKSANEIIGDIDKIKKVTNPIKKKL